MSHQYAPKHFLRQTNVALLQKYFADKKLLADIDWTEDVEKLVNSVSDAWHKLPGNTPVEIDRNFREIFELASTDGLKTVIEEAQQYRKIEITDELKPLDGVLNKIFHVFLYHHEVFEIATRFAHADNLHGRSWNKRKDMPKKKPDISRENLENFEKAISTYLLDTQGRGEKCQVDTYFRGRKKNYFFAYPKDYADTSVEYNADGKLERRPHSPAFEIIFAYDAEEGTLELFAKGDKNLKQALQVLFSKHILHEDLVEAKTVSAPYNLDALKQKGFVFPVDPSDGISDVRIRELCLSVVGRPNHRIIFDVGPVGKKTTQDDIYDIMQHALHEAQLPLSQVKVSSVVIQMRFLNTTGSGRPHKTLSFRVSYPDSCNLKDKEEHLKAKKYLKAWNLESA